MKIQNLFKKKLRKNQVVWCIGVPWTKAQFEECCAKESDFIDSLEMAYGVYDHTMLWEYYKGTAQLLNETIQELKDSNVEVLPLDSLERIKDALHYENIIITVHHHRLIEALDFLDTTIYIDDFINAFPYEYTGTIDVSSCYSAEFIQQFKLQASNSRIIAANTESSLKLRMFIYKNIVKVMTTDKNLTYLDAYRDIAAKIVEYSRTLAGHRVNNVFLGGRIFKKTHKYNTQSASVFAPSEIQRGDTMLVQVYIFWDEEYKKIVNDAQNSDNEAKKRSQTSLDLRVKKGDCINVNLSILGLPLENSSKSFKWQERFSKCCFFVQIPKQYKKSQLAVEVFVSVNNAPIGNMCFLTKVVERKSPFYINAETVSTNFKKIFISYSHDDEDKVKFMDEALSAAKIDHFFDRSYLKPGDVYPEKIKNYINSADLFVLCWSKNAAESDYVQLERKEALALAYPQKDMDKATISIHPISIDPKADLPEDMNKVYNFGEV